MKTHRLTNIGVVTGALLASACCWLPLLLVTLGLGSFGLGAFFESARPWFLGITAVLLVAALFLQLRAHKKPWALLLIAGSALFLPDLLVAGGQGKAPSPSQSSWLLTLPEGADAETVTKTLQGEIPELMISDGAEGDSQSLLLSVPKAEAITAAAQITKALATLSWDTSKAPVQELSWHSYQVDGMACKACTKHFAHALDDRPDILAASVDLDSNSATILTLPAFDADKAAEAVAAAGYHLQKS